MKLVTAKLPEAQVEGLDELVGMRMYQSRSDAIRAAIRDMLKRELWEYDHLKNYERMISSAPLTNMARFWFRK